MYKNLNLDVFSSLACYLTRLFCRYLKLLLSSPHDLNMQAIEISSKHYLLSFLLKLLLIIL